MSKKVTFCENHPDIATSDNCEQCQKMICYNCRRIFVNRIFCSKRCIFHFIRSHFQRLIVKFLRRLIWIATWPFHRLLRIQNWRGLEWGLVLGLAFSIYLNIQLKKELKSFHPAALSGTEQETPVDSTFITPVDLNEPGVGGMVQSNQIDITGEAEENWIISLSLDGRIMAVQLPQAGRFAFNHVRLHRGQNELVVRALNQEGKVVILQSLKLTYGIPTLNYLTREVRRGSLKNRQVAFTFDGGAENNASDEILDYLKQSNIKCTFFLTGRFIQKYPRTVRRIVTEGHEVANHTMSHPHLTTFSENHVQNTQADVTRQMVREELDRTARLFELVTKTKMVRLWRAPYGEYNPEVLRWAADAGYKHIGWTVGHGWDENMDTMDWVADKNAKGYHSADAIAQKILSYARNGKTGANGAIILMHLGTNRKDDFPHRKLPEILNELKKAGYEAVTLSELLSRLHEG